MAKGPFKVSKLRRKHILDGDITGGGHGPGRKRRGKSEFPSNLTDQEIIDGIEIILNDANNYPHGKIPAGGPPIVLIGSIKGVRTIIVADPVKRDAKPPGRMAFLGIHKVNHYGRYNSKMGSGGRPPPGRGQCASVKSGECPR